MSEGWINDVGSVLKSKNGKTFYLQINQDIELKKGDRLLLKNKKEQIEAQVAAGKIDAERGEELKDKLKFIIFEAHKMPNK